MTAWTVALAGGLALVVLCALRTGRAYEEDIESAVFLVTFAAALPIAVIAGEWLDRRGDRAALEAVWPVPLLGLIGAVAVVRVRDWTGLDLGIDSEALLLILLAIAAAITLVAVRAAPRSEEARVRLQRACLWALGVVSAVALFACLASNLLKPLELIGALAFALIAVAVVWLARRTAAVRHARWVDALIVAVLLALVIHVNVIPDGDFLMHQGFYLGPVNSVLHGRQMLVDTYSQYGVGVIDALALYFAFIPIGWGSFALLIAFLGTLQALAMYGAMRLARVELGLCVVAVLVVVAVNIYGQPNSFASYPSIGALRFGLGWLLTLTAVAACRRWPRRGGVIAAAVVLGVASVWSFETFIYTAAAAAGAAAIATLSADAPWRRRWLALGQLALVGVAAIVVAQVVFSLATLAATGSLPHWGPYIDFIRVYSVKKFGTLPVLAWAPGMAIAAGYLVSAAVLARFVLHRPEVIRADRTRFVLIAALTAFGAAAFTYYLGRSHPLNQQHIAPPAIVLAAVWTSWLLSQPRTVTIRRAQLVGSVIAAALAGFLAIAAWHGVKHKVHYSLVGRIVTDGPRATADMLRVQVDNPNPIDGRFASAATLLQKDMPQTGPIGVLAAPNLEVELLFRAGRVNLLPISNPIQDDLTPDRSRPAVAETIADLTPGTRFLLNGPNPEWVGLQRYAYDLLRQRFDLREIDRDGDVSVVELEPRR